MLLIVLLMTTLAPAPGAADESLACNLNALTKTERSSHAKVSRQLLNAVEERRELSNGYALRLPSDMLGTAAEWVRLERRCCPFFTFEIEVTKDGGPLWLRLTGRDGIKPFIRSEFGLD